MILGDADEFYVLDMPEAANDPAIDNSMGEGEPGWPRGRDVVVGRLIHESEMLKSSLRRLAAATDRVEWVRAREAAGGLLARLAAGDAERARR